MKKQLGNDPTVLLPNPAAPESRHGTGWAMHTDRVDAVRGRIRLVALLLIFAFVFDPVLHAGLWTAAHMFDMPLQSDFAELVRLDPLGLSAALASLGLWWISRSRWLSNAALVTTSLVYETMVCFVVAFLSFWHFYIATGVLPHVTWVIGIIILFPLVVPAPPRHVLLAALASAMMPALALAFLVRFGMVSESSGYLSMIVNPLLAAAFAYIAARVVHGLGREAAAFRELGSYRLEARLGQGGMGEVWRARHRLLARPAAIKLIRPDLAVCTDPVVFQEVLRRFECEAQVIAGLRSPHTVTIFDFGVSTEGALYYVMELLDGIDAEVLVRRFGRQPVERVVYLLQQVCHSLSEAESRGVVHRDVKPANIFLCRYGEDCDFVKVLDFGLAKALEGAPGVPENITTENKARGTPAFMAPEQARAQGPLDIRADIYAVGCVAYWLLTGRTVFTAGDPIAHIVAHCTEPAEPPSCRTDVSIPPELDQLILDCLEKNPKHRPQTVKELQRKLAEIDDGTWTSERAREWWARMDD